MNQAKVISLPELKDIPFEVVLHKILTPLAYVETILVSSEKDFEETRNKTELALRRHRLKLEVYLALKQEAQGLALKLVLDGLNLSWTLNLIEECLKQKQVELNLLIGGNLFERVKGLLHLLFLIGEYFWVRCFEGKLKVEILEKSVISEFKGNTVIEVLSERDFEGALLYEYCKILKFRPILEQEKTSLRLTVILGE